MNTILLIDDDIILLKKLRKVLEDSDYKVLTAENYSEMRKHIKASYEEIKCIILDVLLPDIDGIEILEELKINHRTKNVPVIMISARDTEHLVVESLREGADDYISKPIRNNEFLMRIQVSIDRAEKLKNVPIKFLRSENLEVDLLNRTTYIDDELIKLTNKEYHLLILFMKNPLKIFDRKELMNAVWPKNANFESRTVDLHISTLRKKLYAKNLSMYIETIRGMGYRFKHSVKVEK
ncbi:response regulator transcription factor [Clostridiaceae bacterium HSG29]|nr:response regulator transcription factor [Clostridiaceae bacterium HSG29]